jgi:hypothetical protein
MWKGFNDLPWFSNRGQIIQVAAAVGAFFITAYLAWPHLQSNEFLSAGSILFYLLSALVILQLRRFPASLPQPDTVDEDPFPTETNIFTHNFSEGELFTARIHDTNTVKLTLRAIIPNPDKKHQLDPEYLADVEIDTGVYLSGGSETKKVTHERWHIPEAGNSKDRILFSFFLAETYVHLVVCKVDHIDHHARKAIITLCDVAGHKANRPPTSQPQASKTP